MTEKQKLSNIELAKKLTDANVDIKKIEKVLNDVSAFNYKADELYEELSKNTDYALYISLAKLAKKMNGNRQFRELNYFQKRKVLVMIKEAIKAYIAKELTNKVFGEDDEKRTKK